MHVEYECEVAEILSADEIKLRGLQPSNFGPQQGSDVPPDPLQGWEVYVLLTNGRVYGCDLVVSATGASPNTNLAAPSVRSEVNCLSVCVCFLSWV